MDGRQLIFLSHSNTDTIMGNGFMSRPSSAESTWGRVEESRDEDVYQPIRNYDGEIVGWKERSDSDKMRRRKLRDEFLPPESESDDESPPRSPTPPPPKIVLEASNDSDDDDDNAFNKSLDRAPSGKSVSITPTPKTNQHRSRVKDKFKPSVVPQEAFNKETAASRLYKALHVSPIDTDSVIFILTSHSHDQRKKIAKTYKFNHNKVCLLKYHFHHSDF